MFGRDELDFMSSVYSFNEIKSWNSSCKWYCQERRHWRFMLKGRIRNIKFWFDELSKKLFPWEMVWVFWLFSVLSHVFFWLAHKFFHLLYKEQFISRICAFLYIRQTYGANAKYWTRKWIPKRHNVVQRFTRQMCNEFKDQNSEGGFITNLQIGWCLFVQKICNRVCFL